MNTRTIIIAVALLAAIAGAAKAVQDTVHHHHAVSVFAHMGDWWDPAQSWKLKYEDYDRGLTGERFPLSKTVLVALTDAWHCFGLLHRAALLLCGLALGLAGLDRCRTAALALCAYAAMASTFHLLYTYIFI